MMLKYYGIDLIIMAKSKYFQIILLPSRLHPCSIIMMVSEDCNTMKCNAVFDACNYHRQMVEECNRLELLSYLDI